ncbi:MAG: PQQ-dependent dehydrogenase, methanol/ethanol family [Pseudomonadales bacterium]|jgi:quinohemoprotein ethanol dehydrogenase|nr:PQQ-dependent dehydrogenase, methanol/ethanol family [Pseudomonadales bacterium]
MPKFTPKSFLLAWCAAAPLLLTACSGDRAPTAATPTATVAALPDTEWTTYGLDAAETRYSPLAQITASNVGDLGLAWSFDTGEVRGHEATPLIVDGVMYATRPWSSVFALDARSGKLLWNYDPQVDKSMGWKACCDVVNRGVAYYDNKVFVGALDGRLIALDAKTGQVVWETLTVDQGEPYTITGAPRIADGKVLIGNGGAELGTRGYLSAYDAQTGAQAWRFWVVPGNPAQGFENPDVERAAATWFGKWWEVGGGGTPWDSIVYDPDLRLVYVGTGNGSPWSHELRSEGKGDNLYLSSIVALKVDDGRLAWYYQVNPADNWDYTVVQPLMLANLSINGVLRKVIMQAPKNGFFYVLDRETGRLLSADPYSKVTWASGIDLESGRPIETPQARYGAAVAMVTPGPGGAHSWHPMSFNPNTGLVYLPTTQGSSFAYSVEQNFVYKPGTWNTGVTFGTLQGLPRLNAEQYRPGAGPERDAPGALVAWDPIARQPRWVVDYPFAINGGTLSTAGNLVFQGGADGILRAFTADSGDLVWMADLGVGIMAPPVTYALDGTQYLAVLVGWGGASGLIGKSAAGTFKGEGRLWTFKLGGDKNIVPVEGQPMHELSEISFDDNPELLARGADIYGKRCMVCHGANAVSGGSLADLRYALPATYDILDNIVRQGAYSGLGMPNLGKWVSEDDLKALKNWLLSRRAAEMAAVQQAAQRQ